MVAAAAPILTRDQSLTLFALLEHKLERLRGGRTAQYRKRTLLRTAQAQLIVGTAPSSRTAIARQIAADSDGPPPHDEKLLVRLALMNCPRELCEDTGLFVRNFDAFIDNDPLGRSPGIGGPHWNQESLAFLLGRYGLRNVDLGSLQPDLVLGLLTGDGTSDASTFEQHVAAGAPPTHVLIQQLRRVLRLIPLQELTRRKEAFARLAGSENPKVAACGHLGVKMSAEGNRPTTTD
jgi:hypothetical protein